MEYELLWKIVIYICSIGGLFILCKIYNRMTIGICNTDKRLDGQVIIVTGANTGIGKEVALNFAKRGAKVILACRDLVKAHQAREEIVEISNNRNVVVRHLDLASLKSVRQFANKIIDTENRLDVLVNNAGLAGISDKKTEDGLECILQVNYYGPFLLTNLLINLLKKSAPSRIVHVSSVLHFVGRLNLKNMNHEKSSILYYSSFLKNLKLYGDSKLYIITGSNEFSWRLAGSGVTSNSLHPGVIRTKITRSLNPITKLLFDECFRLFGKSPEEGAQTIIYLSIHDKVKNVSGKYFMDCQEAYSLSITRDRETGKKFWDNCCKLVNLKPEERFI